MRSDYWQRKRDTENGIIRITSQIKIVEFTYKGKDYTYKYESNGTSGFAYVYHYQVKIYSPYDNECTDIGKEVYGAFVKKTS